MEFGSYGNTEDKSNSSSKNGVPENVHREIDVTGKPKEQTVPSAGQNVHNFGKDVAPSSRDTSGEVNMETYVTADEVIRAGGFGAKDDISSFLPVASDFTDFESHLYDVRDYEELEDEIPKRKPEPLVDVGELHKDDFEKVQNVNERVAAEDVQSVVAMTENPKEEPDSSAVSREVHNFRKREAPESDFTDFGAYPHNARGYDESEEAKAGLSDVPKNTRESRKVDVKVIENDDHEAVNMEASVICDEVMRAGGFGARDGISSILPVASDFTDYEAHLRDARGYEDQGEEFSRPGLGWTNAAE